MGVLIPKVSVFFFANLVVVDLARKHQPDVIRRIQPYRPNPDVTGGKGDRKRLNDLPKIIDVAACAPKTARKQGLAAVTEHLGGHPKKFFVGLRFKVILLHIRAACEHPPKEEEYAEERGQPHGMTGIGEVCSKPKRNRIKIGVKRQTAESQFEPDPLGDKIVCPQMHFFKDEILKAKPGQHRAAEQEPVVDILHVQYVIRRKRKHVQLEHHRADQIQPQLCIDKAAF